MKFALSIPEEFRAQKSDLLGLLFIMAVAVGLRLHFLSAPIHHDEALTFLEFASKPFYIGISRYSDPNNHLFHTFLVHMVYVLLGHQPWMIRLPALLAGILLIPASYVATRMLYNDKNAALFTAALVGASSSLVRYSVLSRGYSLLCLIFLITLSLAAYLRRNPDSSRWVLLSVFSALGFYTIPIMLYPYGILLVWLALTFASEKTERARIFLFKRLLKSVFLTVALVFALYLPVFVVSGVRAVVANGMVRPKPWAQMLIFQRQAFHITWMDWNKDMPNWISGILLAGFILSIIFHRRISRQRIPLVVPALLWLIPLLLLQRVAPPFRVWLFLLPIYLMIAAAGLAFGVDFAFARFKKLHMIPALALSGALSLLLSWNVFRTDYIYNPMGTIWEGEQITCFLKDYLKTGDGVVAPGDNAEMKYNFILHGLPIEYFAVDPAGKPKERIIYIANEGRGRLDENLNAQGVSIQQVMARLLPEYSQPRQLKRYKYATVYELNRMQ